MTSPDVPTAAEPALPPPRRRAIAITAAVAMAAVAAGVLIGRTPLTAEPMPVKTQRGPDGLIDVRITRKASAMIVQQALHAAGLRATVVAQPVSPSLIGTWQGGDDLYANAVLRIDPDDRSHAVLPPTKLPMTVYVGRRAQRGERYYASVSPFCRGESLYRTGAEDLRPAVALGVMQDHGFAPRWQIIHTTAVLPGRTTRTAMESATPPDGVIADVVQTSATDLVVFVAPPDDFAATSRTIGERC